ncbi:alpha/beta fold hydrolase [Salinactinospora qingdaonensis]|uniref:Alpha/beta hydrolase n=1 Tax=Salinactinospora qingdaonensis TaxID=702744 RepID=A0ABP7GEF9_9ACTN
MDVSSSAGRSGFAPVDNGRLAYESAGEGPALVLLHGGLLDAGMWHEQFAALAATGHYTLRYDARGHGASSTVTGDWSNVEDLRALLDHHEIVRARLVGLSLGARTALDFALACPERVEALVLAAPGISGRAFADPFVLEHTRAQQASLGRPDGAQRFVEHFLRMWVDGPHREPSEVDPAMRERLGAVAAHNVARHASGLGAGTLREVGAAQRLAEVAAPLLTLVGDVDSSDIIGNVDAIVAAQPGARTGVVPGAAHMVNLEAPETFTREVAAFLRAL